MDDEQDHAQEEADRAHSDVGDAQEGVLASHPGDGAQDHPLPALEAAHGIIWVQQVKDKSNSSQTKSFSPLPNTSGKEIKIFILSNWGLHEASPPKLLENQQLKSRRAGAKTPAANSLA